MTQTTRYVLPWAPSANHHWRAIARSLTPCMPGPGALRCPCCRAPLRVTVGQILSAQGRSYRDLVAQATIGQDVVHDRKGRLAVTMMLNPPTRRALDIDNRAKPTLDALTQACAWVDDGQIDDLGVKRGCVVPGGGIIVHVKTL